ncbi:hypothetical protein ABK040_009643 [Willaertia magna]
MSFPQTETTALSRQAITLPKDFKHKLNVCVFGFKKEQKVDVKTWEPFLLDLKQNGEWKDKNVDFYVIPTMPQLFWLIQNTIFEAMYWGTQTEMLQRSIPIHTNQDEFRKSLGIESDSEVCVCVIEKEGKVLSKLNGAFTKEKGQELLQRVNELL